ncbi:hypothetical protein HBB16_12445 [Pseudonocardia sp. MCCB 268]|nr:hypothetical protein [Pseudonocardia cytotoxica]
MTLALLESTFEAAIGDRDPRWRSAMTSPHAWRAVLLLVVDNREHLLDAWGAAAPNPGPAPSDPGAGDQQEDGRLGGTDRHHRAAARSGGNQPDPGRWPWTRGTPAARCESVQLPWNEHARSTRTSTSRRPTCRTCGRLPTARGRPAVDRAAAARLRTMGCGQVLDKPDQPCRSSAAGRATCPTATAASRTRSIELRQLCSPARAAPWARMSVFGETGRRRGHRARM